jgi:hypothetical protein
MQLGGMPLPLPLPLHSNALSYTPAYTQETLTKHKSMVASYLDQNYDRVRISCRSELILLQT